MARAAPTTTKPTTPVPAPVKAKADDEPVVADVPSEELPAAAAVAAAAVVVVVDVDDVPDMVVVVVGAVVVDDEVVVEVVEDVVVVDEADVVVVVGSSVALLVMPLPSAADATPAESIISPPSARAAPKITNSDRILLTISLPVGTVSPWSASSNVCQRVRPAK